ncbi:MAG: acyl-CoA-binding protein [Flavobacterium sp.]
MTSRDLDFRFQEAVKEASKMKQASLPQDVQLRLYAYYKQATSGTANPNFNSNFDLRNAFKMNAWMQIRHLSIDESKEMYIEIINSILKK